MAHKLSTYDANHDHISTRSFEDRGKAFDAYDKALSTDDERVIYVELTGDGVNRTEQRYATDSDEFAKAKEKADAKRNQTDEEAAAELARQNQEAAVAAEQEQADENTKAAKASRGAGERSGGTSDAARKSSSAPQTAATSRDQPGQSQSSTPRLVAPTPGAFSAEADPATTQREAAAKAGEPVNQPKPKSRF